MSEGKARKELPRPLTPEEAQKAYDEAVPVPLSKARISAIVEYATTTDRCPVCHWPLKATIQEGCVPGNCSQRPRPK